jgi:hypothetical protein
MIHFQILKHYSTNNRAIKRNGKRQEERSIYVDKRGSISVLYIKSILYKRGDIITL